MFRLIEECRHLHCLQHSQKNEWIQGAKTVIETVPSTDDIFIWTLFWYLILFQVHENILCDHQNHNFLNLSKWTPNIFIVLCFSLESRLVQPPFQNLPCTCKSPKVGRNQSTSQELVQSSLESTSEEVLWGRVALKQKPSASLHQVLVGRGAKADTELPLVMVPKPPGQPCPGFCQLVHQ